MVFLTTQFIRQESQASSFGVPSTSTPIDQSHPEQPYSPSPLPSNSNSTQFVLDETGLRRFTFSEIKTATRNFSDSLLVGRGGYSHVYRGTINHGGRPMSVAIKRYVSSSSRSSYRFLAEIEMLSMVRHANLVDLICYHIERKEMILVYDFMPKGTLWDHLHPLTTTTTNPLSWTQRLEICLGIAQGLHYLHDFTGVHHGIVHRDVRSANILLDENFTPKITGFGLSKVVPKNNPSHHSITDDYVATRVADRWGYLDPDYYRTDRLTVKSDVYAFGVILLEVLSGRRPIDGDVIHEEHQNIVPWAESHIQQGEQQLLEQIVDSSLKGQISSECLMEFSQIAFKCVQEHAEGRPTMAQVVASLHSILALQERTDDDRSSLVSHGVYSDIDGDEEDISKADSDADHHEEHLADLDDEDHLHYAETVLDGLSASSPSEQQDCVEGDMVNQTGDREHIVTVDDTRKFFWRGQCVSQSASTLLHLVEQHYPQTFQCLKIRRAKVWEAYLEAFEQIMTRFLNLVVADLTEAASVEILTELEELVTYGFDMTWAIEGLDTAARLRDSESLKKELSRLEEDAAQLDDVVERLKQELAAAETQRAEISHLWDAKAEEVARRLDQPGQGSMVARRLGSEHFGSSMHILIFP